MSCINSESCRGRFAKSKAGHDVGKVYIIIEETAEYVFLSDGRLKKTEAPKKKKKKHIQQIKYTDKNIEECIENKSVPTNEMIKRAIKEYNKSTIRKAISEEDMNVEG